MQNTVETLAGPFDTLGAACKAAYNLGGGCVPHKHIQRATNDGLPRIEYYVERAIDRDAETIRNSAA